MPSATMKARTGEMRREWIDVEESRGRARVRGRFRRALDLGLSSARRVGSRPRRITADDDERVAALFAEPIRTELARVDGLCEELSIDDTGLAAWVAAEDVEDVAREMNDLFISLDERRRRIPPAQSLEEHHVAWVAYALRRQATIETAPLSVAIDAGPLAIEAYAYRTGRHRYALTAVASLPADVGSAPVQAALHSDGAAREAERALARFGLEVRTSTDGLEMAPARTLADRLFLPSRVAEGFPEDPADGIWALQTFEALATHLSSLLGPRAAAERPHPYR